MEDGKGVKLLTKTNFLEEEGTRAITKSEAKIEAEKLLILFETQHTVLTKITRCCSCQNTKRILCLPDDDKDLMTNCLRVTVL